MGVKEGNEGSKERKSVFYREYLKFYFLVERV